jgi:hypothetical protein
MLRGVFYRKSEAPPLPSPPVKSSDKSQTFVNRLTRTLVNPVAPTLVKYIPEEVGTSPPEYTCTSYRKLECIALITTSKEINSGRFKTCINSIAMNTSPSPDITLYIITNNKIGLNTIHMQSTALLGLFKQINVFTLDLTPEEDVYNSTPAINDKIPKYGFISGPNIMFLRTMRLCKHFNTTLLIETDCNFSQNWVYRLSKYTEFSGGFWISGALYDGFSFSWHDLTVITHINGVALYATGDVYFQMFIDKVDSAIQEYATKNPIIGYDYAIRKLIDSKLQEGKSSCRRYWLFVNRNYISNQLIINMSPQADKDIPDEYIREKYNYAILHKK